MQVFLNRIDKQSAPVGVTPLIGPVLLGVNGWSQVCPMPLEADEIKALLTAGKAIQNALKIAKA